jgi:hypothetical protein
VKTEGQQSNANCVTTHVTVLLDLYCTMMSRHHHGHDHHHRLLLVPVAVFLLLHRGAWGLQFPERRKGFLLQLPKHFPRRDVRSFSSHVVLTAAHRYRNSDITEGVTTNYGALNDTGTEESIEKMASFLSLRVGMAMLRRLKKQKEEKALLQEATGTHDENVRVKLGSAWKAAERAVNQSAIEDGDEERHALLHRKEFDRILALGDEFSFNGEVPNDRDAGKPRATAIPGVPSCISTAFGRPLVVLQEGINGEESIDRADGKPRATATSEVPSRMSTDFGRPLVVLQEGIPRIQAPPAPVKLEPDRKIAQVEAVETTTHSVPPPESDDVLSVQARKDSDFGRPLVVLQEGIPPLQAPPTPIKLEPDRKIGQVEAVETTTHSMPPPESDDVLSATTHSMPPPESDDVLSAQAKKDSEIKLQAILNARLDEKQQQKEKVGKYTTFKPASYSPFGKKWDPSSTVAPGETGPVTSPPSSVTGKADVDMTAKPANYSPFGKKFSPDTIVAPTGTTAATLSTSDTTGKLEVDTVSSAVTDNSSGMNLVSKSTVAPGTTSTLSAVSGKPADDAAYIHPVSFWPFEKKSDTDTTVKESIEKTGRFFARELDQLASSTEATTKQSNYTPSFWPFAKISDADTTLKESIEKPGLSVARELDQLASSTEATTKQSNYTPSFWPFANKSDTGATLKEPIEKPGLSVARESGKSASSTGATTKQSNYSPLGKKWAPISTIDPAGGTSASDTETQAADTTAKSASYSSFGKKWATSTHSTTEKPAAVMTARPASHSSLGKKSGSSNRVTPSASVDPVASTPSSVKEESDGDTTIPSPPSAVAEKTAPLTTSKPASYSPFGKKFGPVAPGSADTVTSTLAADTTSALTLPEKPAAVTTFKPITPVSSDTVSAEPAAVKPASYSPFGKKFGPVAPGSADTVTSTLAADTTSALTLPENPAAVSTFKPITPTSSDTVSTEPATVKPASYSPFGKKFGPSGMVVAGATGSVSSTAPSGSDELPVDTGTTSTPSLTEKVDMNAKPASYSSFGQQFGPRSTLTSAPPYFATFSAPPPSVPDKLAADTVSVSTSTTPPSIVEKPITAAKPASYSPFVKKWEPMSTITSGGTDQFSSALSSILDKLPADMVSATPSSVTEKLVTATKLAGDSLFGTKWGSSSTIAPGVADPVSSAPASVPVKLPSDTVSVSASASTSTTLSSMVEKPITTAKPASYSSFGKKWGPSSTIASRATGSVKSITPQTSGAFSHAETGLVADSPSGKTLASAAARRDASTAGDVVENTTTNTSGLGDAVLGMFFEIINDGFSLIVKAAESKLAETSRPASPSTKHASQSTWTQSPVGNQGVPSSTIDFASTVPVDSTHTVSVKAAVEANSYSPRGKESGPKTTIAPVGSDFSPAVTKTQAADTTTKPASSSPIGTRLKPGQLGVLPFIADREPEQSTPAPASSESSSHAELEPHYSPLGQKWAESSTDAHAPTGAKPTTSRMSGAPAPGTAVTRNYSPFEKRWGPSSTDALAPAGTSRAASHVTAAAAPRIPSATNYHPFTATATSPPPPYSTAKAANYSPLGKKWGSSSTDALAPAGATSCLTAAAAAAPRTSNVTAKVTDYPPFTAAATSSPAPDSTAKVTSYPPFTPAATSLPAPDSTAKVTSYPPFTPAATSLPAPRSTTKVANYKKWAPSSTDTLAPTGSSATPSRIFDAVASPPPGGTAKTANYSPFGKKWGPSSTDTLAPTPTGASATPSRISAAVASSPPGSTSKVANYEMWSPSSTDTLAPTGASATPSRISDAVASPPPSSTTKVANYKMWNPNSTETLAPTDTLASTRASAIPSRLSDAVASPGPSSTTKVANYKMWSPSSTDTLAHFGGSAIPSRISDAVASQAPDSTAKVANYSPFGKKWGPSSTDTLAPTGSSATPSRVSAAVAFPAPGGTAKVANYSPFGKKWGPSSTEILAPTGASPTTSRISPATASPAPGSTANVSNYSTFGKWSPSSTDTLASTRASATPSRISDAVASQAPDSTAKVANYSPFGKKWGPSSTEILTPTGASPNSIRISDAVASPAPDSTAKVANHSLFGKNWGPSSTDTLAPTGASATPSRISAAVASPAPDSTAKIASYFRFGKKWGPSSTDTLAPTGASATPSRISDAVASPAPDSTAEVANYFRFGKKWGPSSTEILAPTGASATPSRISDAVASPAPDSTAKVANYKMWSPSSTDTLAPTGASATPSRTSDAVASQPPGSTAKFANYSLSGKIKLVNDFFALLAEYLDSEEKMQDNVHKTDASRTMEGNPRAVPTEHSFSEEKQRQKNRTVEANRRALLTERLRL